MTNKNLFTALFILCAASGIAHGQQAAYFDAAQAYNRLLIEKNNGTYFQVNNFKVVGTPYLFGEKNLGYLFAKGETAYNIYLSYNTYNQEIDFYSSANPNNALVKEPQLMDSFVLKQKISAGIVGDMTFVSGPVLGVKDNSFYNVLYRGPRLELYKKYKSVLGIVTTNYIQSELRQFNLAYEYFYFDRIQNKLSKLKPTSSFLKKQLGKAENISSIIDEESLSANPDVALKAIFAFLNDQ